MYKHKHAHIIIWHKIRVFLPHHIPVRCREPQEEQQRNKRETDKHSEPKSFSKNTEMLYTHNREKRASTNINMCQEFGMSECFSSHNSWTHHKALMAFENE